MKITIFVCALTLISVVFLFLHRAGTHTGPNPGRDSGGAASGRERLRGIDGEKSPLTIEGIEETIAMLAVQARNNPEVNIDIAEKYYLKAKIYGARLEDLKRREDAVPPGNKDKFSQRRVEVESWRVQTLLDAKEALNKLTRNIYGDTDVRLIKALIYFHLPDGKASGIAELKKIVEGSDALPAVRREARNLLSKYSPLMEK